MARRATVLEGYRREPVPTLTLVGADEFSPDTELPDPAKTGDASPEAVRAVYDALHVDCGMLSAGAAAWFGSSRPRNFFEVGDTPVTKRFHVGGVPVAVILFPPLSAGGTPETEAPTPKLLASVLAAADANPYFPNVLLLKRHDYFFAGSRLAESDDRAVPHARSRPSGYDTLC